MKRRNSWAIALVGGLLMGLTVAPGNVWWLAWVALAPLWVLLLHPLSANRPFAWRLPLLLGASWGIGYHGLALSWIRDLHPLTWLGMNWWASVGITLFAWSAITLFGGCFVALWAGGFYALSHTEWRLPLAANPKPPVSLLIRVLFGVSLWCALEWLWSNSPLWWTSLGLTQSPHNLAILHLGQLSGPNTVTAAIVAVNGTLAEAWIRVTTGAIAENPHPHLSDTGHSYPAASAELGKMAVYPPSQGKARRLWPRLLPGHLPLRGWQSFLLPLAIALVLHGLGFLLYQMPALSADASLRIGIIQGNIPTRVKLTEAGMRRAVQTYTDGYRQLADQGADAVLTPEGAFPWYWLGSDRSRDPFYQAILEKGVPVWLGTPGLENGRITQSLVTIAGNGAIVSHYNKIKLVPLGEYLPLESLLGLVIRRLSPVELSMVPGHLDQQVNTPVGQAIGAICFDSAFSEIFRYQAAAGGEFIVTASNNDPYGRAMMSQHHAQDVMRAIETSRWAVRATNTGLSSVIDPHGQTIWMSNLRTTTLHLATIDRRHLLTLYVQWGDWLTPTLLGLSLVAAVVRCFPLSLHTRSPDKE